jgi:hypothetical protein
MADLEKPKINEYEYIDEYIQLPSITGKDVIYLEKYAKLPRTRTYEHVKVFLENARKAKEVRTLFIVAEWGEGKTSIYEGFLKRPEVIGPDLVIPIPTKRLITHIKEKAGTLFYDVGSLGIRLFACLLYTVKDIIDNDLMNVTPFDKIKIEPKKSQQKNIEFIRDALDSIFNIIPRETRIFFFIDEFEDILDESEDVRSLIVSGLIGIIDGSPSLLYQDPFAGRIHFMIAVTPPAYEKLKAETYANWQRFFGQRVDEVRLEKLDRKSARDYILGILKYCWNGHLLRIPFSEPGMFNAIYVATAGNPRSIIKLVETLLGYAKSRAKSQNVFGKVILIKPRDFIDALRDKKITIYGGEVSLLDSRSLFGLLDRLEKKCGEMNLEFNKCVDVLYLLLSNLSPISLKELGEKVRLEEKEVEDYLAILRESFKEFWGIDRPFMLFKKVIGEAKDIRLELMTREKSLDLKLSKLIDALEFYEFDENYQFKDALFVPYRRLSDLKLEDERSFQNYIDFFTSFSPEIGSEDIETLINRYIFDRVKKSDENYVMLSPMTLNIFYPSPSIFFLDFIEDLNKRFEIGTELMRNLTKYEKEFREGIFKLLQDRHGIIRVNRTPERCSYGKEVDVVNIYYKAVEEYHLRAYVLPLLKTSEKEVREEIGVAIEDMKKASIPLLIIFCWNPLPTELRATLETLLSPLLSPKTEKDSGRVFYYLEFPLTFMQCQQVCSYVVAKKKGYKINEEKWKARISRMLDEIKFETRLGDFIREGLSAGYTVRLLALRSLRPNDVPKLFRTLLITTGNIEERYRQLEELEKKYKVYGEDFPVCPLDIESEKSFRALVNELRENGLIEVEGEKILELNITPIERRILSILKEYGGKAEEDVISKLFILPYSQGSPQRSSLDVYFNMLVEREKIRKEDKSFRLVTFEEWDEKFESLKKKVEEYKKKYSQSPFGYLVSIKQRNVNTIILKECIEEIAKFADSLRRVYEDEVRVKKIIQLYLLVNQLSKIAELMDEFYKKFSENTSEIGEEASAVRRSLEDWEKFASIIFNRNLEIKEKKAIEEKKRSIDELKKKTYDRKEMEEYLNRNKEKIEKSGEPYSELYKKPRGCLVFDVKMIQLMEEYEDLREIINKVKEKLDRLKEIRYKYNELERSISEHGFHHLECQKENKLCSLVLNWMKRFLIAG